MPIELVESIYKQDVVLNNHIPTYLFGKGGKWKLLSIKRLYLVDEEEIQSKYRVFFVLYMEDWFFTKYLFIWSVCHQLIYLVKSSFDGVIKLWCFNIKISKLIYVVIKLWSKLIYVVIRFPQNISSYGVSFSYTFTICMSFLTKIASQYMY